MRIRIICVFMLSLLLVSCKKHDVSSNVTNANVIGDYVGKYYDGIEMFVIRPNGTFQQIYKKNGIIIYTQEGKWQLMASGSINFSPFMGLIDYSGKNTKFGNPKATANMSATFNRDPDRIELGPWPYSAIKQN